MSKKKKHGEHGEVHPDERWLITYADMVTLLLAVFIVLYALSDTNVRKFTEFAQSVSAAFTTDIFKGSQAITITAGLETAPDVGTKAGGAGVVASDYAQVKATLKDYAIGKGLDEGLKVDQVPEGIAIRIRDALLFQPGRAVLDDRSREVVARIAGTLAGLPNGIRVEGNTDDVAPVGPFFADNWQLSTARALSVLNTLTLAGIAPARLAAAGRAEFNPLVPNADDAARATNRRVDILILYPDPSGAPGGSDFPTASDAPFDLPLPGGLIQ
jgi:chemotaxis protein MotB